MKKGIFWVYLDMLRQRAVLDMKNSLLSYKNGYVRTTWVIQHSSLPEYEIYLKYGVVK